MMRFRRVQYLLNLGWVILVSYMGYFAAPAFALDANEIMARADRMNRPKFEISRMRMELKGDDGDILQRELVWYFVNEGASRKSLLKFTSPANVQGVGILVIEDEGKANAIWHYQPATRNVRRISSEHKQNRFMGTEFVFEDFEGLKLNKYTFSLLRNEPCGQGSLCYVVEGSARDSEERESSGYGKKIFWIDQGSFAIVKTDLYDRSNVLAKEFENLELRQVGKYWRPRRQIMTNKQTGRSTVMVEMERKLDVSFDKYYIGQQYLRSE